MKQVIKAMITFWKKETVLMIAVILAAISMVIIPPDLNYIFYIDFRTLGILFCLMAVVAGMKQIHVFDRLAQGLLAQVRGSGGIVLTLVLLCFFLSMLITNDVALITFVPFTIIIMKQLGEKVQRTWMLRVVVMQTIAANLGSMLTPIGNPQNLYLYGKAQMSAGAFILLMLPYSLVSLLLLVLCAAVTAKRSKISVQGVTTVSLGDNVESETAERKGYLLPMYLLLFLLCLFTVARVIPYPVTLVIVAAAVLILDRSTITKVDYSLLLTFVGFFVFIGNMGRMPAFRDFLQGIIGGREVMTSVIASQVISNVPAALLLSGFTEDVQALIVGTNLGGLGTLIASMASLISYKQVAGEIPEEKKRYFGWFTVANIAFLAILLVLNIIL